ncbi:hypothetical protein JCM19274_1252 [Algibacter lectus]|uniref:Uncharacterized protein n=1 Tax=Algibacter lectus TaxID=221126 RepID=A0A090WUD8_9FLAO|nr:hypothetical protein [Algibacter lectus]GAL80626.1 hypothetical protein JCM19274_1252 [Algibacter lectus]
MVWGIPIVLLLGIELYLKYSNSSTSAYDLYETKRQLKVAEPQEAEDGSNNKGTRVIGIGVALTGLLILILSFIGESAQLLVGGMGVSVLVLGLYIIRKTKK